MTLRCKEEITLEGEKLFKFTRGEEYEFTESIDPEGWEVIDDSGCKEVFFNPFIMFER